MYPDDSIICCLFPNKCNMFPQTPVVIFSNIMEYLNMLIVLSSLFFIVWSILQIILRFVEEKERKLIEPKDSEDSCFEEQSLEKQSLEKQEETKCSDDDYFSDNNNYDGDGDNSCSDSDLQLNPANSIIRQLVNKDSDCYNSNIESSEDFIRDIKMDTSIRSSSFPCKPNSSSSSSNDDRKNCDHLKENHQFTFVASFTESPNKVNLAVVDEKEFMQAVKEDTNTDQSKDTLPVSDTDSINQKQRQNKLSDHQT